MIKQLLLQITGEFNSIEFKNLVSDRTDTFNFQYKALHTPNIRFSTKMRAEDTIAILLDGEEEEIRQLGESLKRGPLTSHIAKIEELWRDAKDIPRAGAGRTKGRNKSHTPNHAGTAPTKKRRRRRRRPSSDSL